MKELGRLQFRHLQASENFEGVFETRDVALKYLTDIVDENIINRLDESRAGEPMVVKYKDSEGNVRVILAIGVDGEPGDGILAPYHIIDSANMEEGISNLSGATEQIRKDLQAEIERALAAEESISGNVTTLSAETIRIESKLDEEIAARKAVDGQTGQTYEANISLTERPIEYIASATSLNDADVMLDQALQELDAEVVKNIVVNDVEGVVKDNVATVTIDGFDINLVGDLDYSSYTVSGNSENKPHPIHNNYTVLDAVKQLDINMGQNKADVDNALADEAKAREEADKVLQDNIDNLSLVAVEGALDANVKEAYKLVNKEGKQQGATINIYKDSSLEKAYLGHTDDRLSDINNPASIVEGTGNTALCFVYLQADGTYTLVSIDVEHFLIESEFAEGLNVNNHVVSVKIDETSETFLTVSADGIKLSGVQAAIDSAKNALQDELDATQTGAGLAEDGTYIKHNELPNAANYIAEATSLDDATVKLDTALKTEETARIAADNTLQSNIDTEKGRAEAAEATLQANIDGEKARAEQAEAIIQSNVDAEKARAKSAEEALQANIDAEKTERIAEDTELETLIKQESARAEASELVIQNELNATQAGAGLAEDGTYIVHDNVDDDITNYIYNAVSLDDATVKLDAALKTEETARIASNNTLQSNIDTEKVRAEAAEEVLTDNLAAEVTRATDAETALGQRIATEETNRQTKDNALQNEIDNTQVGAGLAEDGSYVPHNTDGNMGEYISKATSLDDAIFKLDQALKTEVANRDNDERTLQNELDITQVGAGLNTDGRYSIDNTKMYISAATSLYSADQVLDDAIAEEKRRATLVENDIIAELNATQAGAGLAEDGSYVKHNTVGDMGNYIAEATSLDDAIVKLDAALKAEEEDRIAADSALTNSINAEAARARGVENQITANLETLSNNAINSAVTLNGKIEALDTKATESASSLNTKIINEVVNRTSAINTLSGNTVTAIEAAVSDLAVKAEGDTYVSASVNAADNKKVIVSANVKMMDDITSVTTIGFVADAKDVKSYIDNAKSTLDSDINTLSASTIESIDDINDAITEINSNVVKNAVKSTNKTINVSPATEGTDLSVNIDKLTIVENNGVISSGVKLAKVTTDLPENVKEAYRLVDVQGNILSGDLIYIYKDSSLKSVRVDGQELVFTYILSDGTENEVKVNVSDFLHESEFTDGLNVVDHVVSVKIDTTSETFLTVGKDGVKLSGVQDAINTAVVTEAEVRRTVTGQGDIYVANTEDYISGATSLNAADIALAHAIKDTNTTIDAVSAQTKQIIESGNAAINSDISQLRNDATTSASTLNGRIDLLVTESNLKYETTNDYINQLSAGTVNGLTKLNNDIASDIADETANRTTAINDLRDSLTNSINTLSANTENAITAATDALEIYATGDTYVSASVQDKKKVVVNANLVGNLYGEITERGQLADAKDIKDYILDTASDINDNITTLSGSVETAIANLNTITESNFQTVDARLDAVEARTINGADAIAVEGDTNKTVKLNISANDKVLSQNTAGITANLSLVYLPEEGKINLIGKDNTIISQISTSDFVKDGMINDVELVDGRYLVFIFNTDEGERKVQVDLNDLIDVYTVGSASAPYMTINDFVIDLNVNQTDGLAGFNQVSLLSGTVETMNAGVNVPGSYRHTIDDVLIKSPEVGTASKAQGSLVRYFVDETGHKYYVSNDANDMTVNGENLANVITSIADSLSSANDRIDEITTEIGNKPDGFDSETLWGAIDEVSTETIELITTLSGRVETLEDKVETLENELAELKATMVQTIKNTVAELLSGTAREIAVTPTRDADGNATNITIGFTDDAVFGPISLS